MLTIRQYISQVKVAIVPPQISLYVSDSTNVEIEIIFPI